MHEYEIIVYNSYGEQETALLLTENEYKGDLASVIAHKLLEKELTALC